jgi:peptidoglycan/xylan/chitin deacetylase (PgdA/CDA1 family)
MYHYIEPWTPGLSLIERGLTVQPDDFVEQMRYLHDQGYVTVSLYDLVAALTLGQPLPPKAIVLTFDGGHRSLLQYAVPVMQPYGFTGTIFAITKGIDRGEALYVTWEQAQTLQGLGWKIEPHTQTHQQLAGRDRAFQWSEINGSLQAIETHLGTRPRFFAYPSGKYDDTTIAILKDLGFWGSLTVQSGRWHTLQSLYVLSRLRIMGTGTLQNFKTAVDGDLQP